MVVPFIKLRYGNLMSKVRDVLAGPRGWIVDFPDFLTQQKKTREKWRQKARGIFADKLGVEESDKSSLELSRSWLRWVK